MKALSAFAAGILFGLGLTLSGMSDPLKVLGFLDVVGDWIPDLAFVMGGALLVSAAATPWVLKRTAPRFTSQFHLPTIRTIDKRLAIGASTFWRWLGTIRLLSRTRYGQPTVWLSSDDYFLSGNGRWHAAGGRPQAIANSVKSPRATTAAPSLR